MAQFKPATAFKPNIVIIKLGSNDKIVGGEIVGIVREVAQEKNVAMIDLYTASKAKVDLLPDGVHPNAAGAKILAETVEKVLTAMGD